MLDSRIFRGSVDAGGVLTLNKKVAEVKTFAADFTDEGALLSGDTIASATVSLAGAGAPTAGAAAVLAADFYDSDRSRIRTGKGVSFRLSAGTAGTYKVTVLAVTAGGDTLACEGYIVVEAA